MINAAYSLAPRLPWETDPQQERRFKIILMVALILAVFFCLLTVVIEVPQKTRDQAEVIPPRLAKFIKDKKLIPPPPPPPKIREKLEEPKAVEKKPEKVEKKPKPKPKIKPIVKKKPLNNREKAARKVAKKHISEFSSILSELSEFRPLPSASKRLIKGGGNAAKTDRSLITSRSSSKSGGVSVARASQTIASVSSELIAQEVTQVESSIADIEASVSEHSSQGRGRRTREEIQRVFDRNKSSIYALYNRALRKDPGLEGTVIFHIVVEPDGQISLCEIVSSELEDEALNRKIIAKIRMFNFGSNQVETWDDTFYMDFIPS